jgi:hypothetical protein
MIAWRDLGAPVIEPHGEAARIASTASHRAAIAVTVRNQWCSVGTTALQTTAARAHCPIRKRAPIVAQQINDHHSFGAVFE